MEAQDIRPKGGFSLVPRTGLPRGGIAWAVYWMEPIPGLSDIGHRMCETRVFREKVQARNGLGVAGGSAGCGHDHVARRLEKVLRNKCT